MPDQPADTSTPTTPPRRDPLTEARNALAAEAAIASAAADPITAAQLSAMGAGAEQQHHRQHAIAAALVSIAGDLRRIADHLTRPIGEDDHEHPAPSAELLLGDEEAAQHPLPEYGPSDQEYPTRADVVALQSFDLDNQSDPQPE